MKKVKLGTLYDRQTSTKETSKLEDTVKSLLFVGGSMLSSKLVMHYADAIHTQNNTIPDSIEYVGAGIAATFAAYCFGQACRYAWRAANR